MWPVQGYEPLVELGRGSTGLVVCARDVARDTIVAMRYVTREVTESTDFDRYRGDFDLLRLVGHPNWAAVYELVELAGGTVVVTEFVDGASLREILRRTGPLEPPAATYVLVAALLALSVLHRHGLVHRGVRPDNLLVDSAGTVKVVDAGIIQPTFRRMPANPAYAAPELYAGAAASPASDVFAAAATLFESLTGEPPRAVDGGHPGRAGRPPDETLASAVLDGVPPPIRRFLSVGLAPDPHARLVDAWTARHQLELAAFESFAPTWYDSGRQLLRERVAYLQTVRQPALAPLPPSPPPLSPPPAGLRTAEPRSPLRNATSPETADPDAAGDLVEPWPIREHVIISHRRRDERMPMLLVTFAILLIMAAGIAFAVTSTYGLSYEPRDATGATGTPTVALPGPTVASPSPTGPGADTVEPTRPTDLRVIGRNASEVSLDWTASTDDVRIAGYMVLRNGARIATTDQPGFTDRGLLSQTTYLYAVTAFDATGNVSEPSPAASVTTLKALGRAPTTPNPGPAPRVTSVRVTTLQIACSVSLFATVEVSAPTVVELRYTITGLTPGTVRFTFTNQLALIEQLPDPDGAMGGTVTVTAGNLTSSASWSACGPQSAGKLAAPSPS